MNKKLLNKDFNFIFLVYYPRSGSTFLAQKMSTHSSDIAVLPEIKMMEILLLEGEEAIKEMANDDIIKLLVSDPRWKNLGIDQEELVQLIESYKPQGIKALVTAICNCTATKQGKADAQYFLVKSGTNLWLYDKIKALFPDSTFLHIKRDARGTVASLLHTKAAFSNRKTMGRPNPILLSRRWLGYVSRVKELSKKDKKVIEVSYEELCLNFDVCMETLFKQLNIKATQAVEVGTDLNISNEEGGIHANIKKAPIEKRIYAWKEELPKGKGYIIEYLSRSQLDELYFAKQLNGLQKAGAFINYYIQHLLETGKYYINLLVKLVKRKPDLLLIKNKIKYVLMREGMSR